jgi:hypothetical protein
MKHVKDSTPAEQAANLAALIRGAKPKIITGSSYPADPPKMAITYAQPKLTGTSSLSLPPKPDDGKQRLARDMTEDERAAFLAEHKKKFA